MCILHVFVSDCPYGDKVQWCLHIGTIYPTDTCLTGGNVKCCETCYKLNEQHSKFSYAIQ